MDLLIQLRSKIHKKYNWRFVTCRCGRQNIFNNTDNLPQSIRCHPTPVLHSVELSVTLLSRRRIWGFSFLAVAILLHRLNSCIFLLHVGLVSCWTRCTTICRSHGWNDGRSWKVHGAAGEDSCDWCSRFILIAVKKNNFHLILSSSWWSQISPALFPPGWTAMFYSLHILFMQCFVWMWVHFIIHIKLLNTLGYYLQAHFSNSIIKWNTLYRLIPYRLMFSRFMLNMLIFMEWKCDI